jgi:predicted N-acyltransferase
VTISTRVIQDFASIEKHDWDRLSHADNPFLSHAFLAGLELTGSISADTGWRPHHLALFHDEELLAFAPTYIKAHSHGEFVFDWAWADAYHRHGRDYYPKLLTAIPYSPVTGPRLLINREYNGAQDLRRQLRDFALSECDRHDFSSWHCNFTTSQEHSALTAPQLLGRRDWQFHWFNRAYADFDDFLGRFRSRKRKNIRRERRHLREAGFQFDWKTGGELLEEDIDFIYACYVSTFQSYGNHPALRKAFFAHLAENLQDRFLVVTARREEQAIAMGLFLSGGKRLYGRYWGCVEEIPGLHFEVAYYQGIEYCIANGIEVFESGAQGEHKIGRGFIPTMTRSFHYIRDSDFKAAIADFLQRENSWLDEYRESLDQHHPFRRDQS